MAMSLESAHFPYVPVHITLGEATLELELLVDSGFEGEISLPEALIPEGEEPYSQTTVQLADESARTVPVYYGVARIGDFDPLPARIIAMGSELIIGRGIADLYSITLDHGQRVIVTS